MAFGGDTELLLAQTTAAQVAQLASTPELVQAIGAAGAARLSHESQKALAALSEAQPEAWARGAVDLARRCIGLAAEVEQGFDDGTVRCSEEITDEAWDWDFGVVVAEAMANGLAAAAMVLPRSSESMELLEEIGRDLDCLAVHLFAGLCRLQSLATTVREARLRAALSGICIWALECVCRTVGFERFTPAKLWEFASCDPLWALALVGGVLAFVEGRSGSSVFGGGTIVDPPVDDVDTLQRIAMAAACGLPSPVVAFLAEVEGDVEEAEDTTIAERSLWLARHRLLLASAVVECDIGGLLIRSCARIGAGPDLAAFLATLLQPELVKDPTWAAADPHAAQRMQEARAAAAALGQHLMCHAVQLWDASTMWSSTLAQHYVS